MKANESPPVPEDEEWLSPAYQLLAAVLCGDNSEQALRLASDEVLKSLVERLEECGVREEFGLSAVAGIKARTSMIRYIEEFAQKDTDRMRLSGTPDVVLDNEPRHNAGAASLEKAGFGCEEDEGGNRIRHIQTQWDANRTLYSGTANSALKLPPERAHWLSPKKFADTNHRVNSRNIPPLMRVLIELSQETEGIIIDGRSYKPDEILGIYSAKSAPTYYINPIATDLILKKCGWAPPIRKERLNWIPISMFVEEQLKSDTSGTNINRLSLLVQVLLADEASSFIIEGKNYKSSELFGRYSKKGPSSYYINPIAVDLIKNAIGRIPLLPKSKLHWQSSTVIAGTFYNGAQVTYYIDQLDKLAVRLLSAPNEMMDAGSKNEPSWVYSDSVVGRFRRARGKTAYFFNPGLEDFLQKKLGVFRELPDDKRHFLSTSDLARMAGLRVAQADMAIRKIAAMLRAQDEIDFTDPASGQTIKIDPRSVIVEVLHIKGRGPRIYCEPKIANQYFGQENVFHVAAQSTTMDRGAQSQTPQAAMPLSIEKRDWIPFSAIRIRVGIYKPTDPLASVLREYLQYLCDQGNIGVGYFGVRRGLDNGGTYFAEPEMIGHDKIISREILLSLQGKTRPQFSEVFAQKESDQGPHF